MDPLYFVPLVRGAHLVGFIQGLHTEKTSLPIAVWEGLGRGGDEERRRGEEEERGVKELKRRRRRKRSRREVTETMLA